MTDASGQNPTHHLRAKNRADLKRQLENATYEIVRETSLGGAEWPKDIEYRLLPSGQEARDELGASDGSHRAVLRAFPSIPSRITACSLCSPLPARVGHPSLVSVHAEKSVNRRVAIVLAGVLLCVAGIVVFLLTKHARQDCFAPLGSGTGVVPSARHSGLNCTVANWSYSLAIAAVICGAVLALLGIVVIVRDRVASIGDRAS